MLHPDTTIQSQYAASPVIRQLVEGMNKRIDPAADISLFYAEIFNILTARGWGLDNWGRILGIGRYIDVDEEEPFSFYGSLLQPFDQGTFDDGVAGVTNRYALADEAYRELLLYKALANISASDAATMNRLLSILYRGQTAYALEIGVMALRFVFEFDLKPYQRTIFKTYGMLTRGAGVMFEWYTISPQSTFGFAGSHLQPFDMGVFDPFGIQQ